ncbi:MAG: hypothetical protein WC711_00760 [Candidatus Staskawiczbacteria bacterium]|jgi:hypothetical protein
MAFSQKKNIFIIWLKWHFLEVPKFLLEVWQNYVLFVLNYFSLPTLLKSLFSPWRRYRWNYPKGFQIGEIAGTFLSNVFSRFLGFLMRIVLIVLGILLQVFVIFLGAVIFLFWILVPIIILVGFWFVLFY